MSLSISLLPETPEANKNWDRFVTTCPGGTFFHLSGWRDVIKRSFGHNSLLLTAQEGEEIVGLLPLTHMKSRLFGNALISQAFCMGGGALARDTATYEALDRAATEHMAELGASYVEYRAPVRRKEGRPCRDDLYANFARPLPQDVEEALKLIPRKQRAVVRKALKNEALETRVERTADDFFKLYALSVRNLGTPVFAKRYFTNLLDQFGEACDVLTITHEGRPVSSVLSFYFQGRVMPYYTGATMEARRLGSNDLMYWQLMRRGIDKGLTTFDFGRSKVDTGPFAFKKNWGFTPEPIAHEFILKEGEQLPNLSPANPKYHLAVRAWQKLPLSIANRLGPFVVRNIG